MTTWPGHAACCIVKATDTHSEYVIFIAFQRRELFPRTRLSVSLYVRAHRLFCVFCVQAAMLQRIPLGNTFECRGGMGTLMMANNHENLHGK